MRMGLRMLTPSKPLNAEAVHSIRLTFVRFSMSSIGSGPFSQAIESLLFETSNWQNEHLLSRKTNNQCGLH